MGDKHLFQPYPADLMEINPFTRFSSDWALVTSGHMKDCNTMTVGWGGFGVLWGKNVVYIFVRESRYTKEFIDKSHLFSLAFFDETQRDALKYCGAHSGRYEDKWNNAGLTPQYRHGIPYPDEAGDVILCDLMASVPITEDTFINPDIKQKWYADGDYHTMYVGEVIEIMVR